MNSIRTQSGVSLPIALIMLVALMVGSVALLRSVDTATLVAGNLAFKHASTLAADRGIETAVAWLRTQTTPGALNTTQPSAGYCSSQHSQDATAAGWNPTTDWTAACTPRVLTSTDVTGYQIDYLIHRLCANPDQSPAAQPGQCSIAGGTSTGDVATSSKRSGRELISNNVTNVAYRITVRVRADRGTRSFVQATVLIPDSN